MLNRRIQLISLLVGCVIAAGCNASKPVSTAEAAPMTEIPSDENVQPIAAESGVASETTEAKHVGGEYEIATFGAGCFWCVEAVFEELEGVISVDSGYMGGRVVKPTYEQVCSGRTGHAEVCRITFDPAKISFDELLEVFWQTHDPTTLNQQGHDVGTQYRSAVFYHSPKQKELAEQWKKVLDESGAFRSPIVTEITAASVYYQAEDYHQDYFAMNPYDRYCNAVAKPKIDKVRKVFKDKLKKAGDSAE
jgi:peptide-methionine (S)-S-oxide reductase